MKQKKLIILTFTVISIFLISYNILQEKVVAASKFENLPKNIEIENYIVDITESTLFENYLLTKYTIETLDKSPISNNAIIFDAIITSNNKNQKNSNSIILKESNISNNKIEIISLNFISTSVDKSTEVTYSLSESASNTNKKINIYNNYELQKYTNYELGYFNIADYMTIDNSDIIIENLLLEKTNGILCFYTNNENFHPDDYIIKLKSNDFEDIFLINDTNIKNSYYSPMNYNDNDIDLNSIEVHLINIYSNNKTLIYSNSNSKNNI